MLEKLDSLANKGFKYLFIAIIAVIIASLVMKSDKPDEVANAELELWQAYNDAGIYDRLTCKSGDIDSNWVVVCRSKNGGNNGVYEVELLQNKQYRIHYVNGSAKTHVRLMGKPYTFNESTTVNINKAIEELG